MMDFPINIGVAENLSFEEKLEYEEIYMKKGCDKAAFAMRYAFGCDSNIASVDGMVSCIRGIKPCDMPIAKWLSAEYDGG